MDTSAECATGVVGDELESRAAGAPGRTWAGHGSGGPCDRCGRVIGDEDIEYEVEIIRADQAQALHLHFDCYHAWMGEARRRR